MPVNTHTLARFVLGFGLVFTLTAPISAQTAPSPLPVSLSSTSTAPVIINVLEAPMASYAVDRANQRVIISLKGAPFLVIPDEEGLLSRESTATPSTAQILAEQMTTALNQFQQNHPSQALILARIDQNYQVRTAEDQLLFSLSPQIQAANDITNPTQAHNLTQQLSSALQLPSRVQLSPTLLAEIKPVQPTPLEQFTQGIKEFISHTFQGRASWYGGSFHGRRSASGSIYQASELTAAHRSLPFGTRVLVTNLQNGRRVIVKVTDRGPFVGNRILDVSRAAALSLGMIQAGVAKVRIDVLRLGQ